MHLNYVRIRSLTTICRWSIIAAILSDFCIRTIYVKSFITKISIQWIGNSIACTPIARFLMIAFISIKESRNSIDGRRIRGSIVGIDFLPILKDFFVLMPMYDSACLHSLKIFIAWMWIFEIFLKKISSWSSKMEFLGEKLMKYTQFVDKSQYSLKNPKFLLKNHNIHGKISIFC